MQETTYIADAVEIAKDKSEYDTSIKTILSDKNVLAWIISRSVKELKGYPIDVIKNCIEGEPEISKIPIVPGKTNEAIRGDNTEDKVLNEGTVYFDIRFTILMRACFLLKKNVNLPEVTTMTSKRYIPYGFAWMRLYMPKIRLRSTAYTRIRYMEIFMARHVMI